MALPQVGEVHDGYRYEGGDPNTKGSWAWVGEQTPGASASGAFDASIDSAAYRKALGTARAKSDIKRIEDTSEMERAAYGNEATAYRAADVLAQDTPTGPMAGMRIALGRSPLGHMGSALPGVPTKAQTANLETVQTLGNQGALGQVGQLKGPLSDRDVMFLKTLQYSPDASPAQNQRVVEAQKWVAKRQAAYASALRTWTEKLGSPSAINPAGMSFDRWWGGYSTTALPPPTVGSAHGPKRPITASAPRKGAPPAWEVLGVED